MAGGSNNNQDGGLISGINVTPLVDIVLVLLIVFMVTAKVMVTPAVPMELPKASQSEHLQVVFSVVVPLQGPVLINGEPARTDKDITARAAAALKQDPEVRAVINADGAVPHRRVMHILDVVKRSGIARVAFGAEPPGEEEAP